MKTQDRSEWVIDEVKRSEALSLEQLWERERELREAIAQNLERLSAVRVMAHDKSASIPTSSMEGQPQADTALFCKEYGCMKPRVVGLYHCAEHAGASARGVK